MIGKQIKGRSFRGVLNYLEQSEGAEIIAGNMSGRNAIELSKEFRLSRQLNPEVERAVYHASLSLAPGEHLDNDTWNEITSKYLKEMGFDSNQYVVYRHSNTDHDHVHIVASRIRLDDSKVVHDGWDYVRSENLIRELEKEYGLQQAPPSYEKKERSLSAGQSRRMEREQAEYESGQRNSPPERPVKEKLQTTINEAIQSSNSMPELIKNLVAENVSVRCEFTRTGKSKGISYEMDGIAFSGTKLGKGYTFPGLQKHSSITYDPNTDQELITNVLEYARTAQKINPHELEEIVPSKSNSLNQINQLNQQKLEHDLRYELQQKLKQDLKQDLQVSKSREKEKERQQEIDMDFEL